MIPVRARLGTGELAAILDCSREWVARQCKAGVYPCDFIAGRYRFTVDDVAAIEALARRSERSPPVATLHFDDLPKDAVVCVVGKRRKPLDVHHYARI